MKVLVEVADSYAEEFINSLNGNGHLKATVRTDKKATLLQDLQEANRDMKRILHAEKRSRPMKALLDEL